MKLTDNEKAFIKLVSNSDTAEGQMNDNYSNAGMDEATILMGGNKHAASGLIGSLEKKGIGYMDEEGYDQFWLIEDTIYEVFEALKDDSGKSDKLKMEVRAKVAQKNNPTENLFTGLRNTERVLRGLMGNDKARKSIRNHIKELRVGLGGKFIKNSIA